MKVDTNFLCDLWMTLSQFSNHPDLGYEDRKTLVAVMNVVENVLILKLQDEVPNITKILAVLTDFGASEFPTVMYSLLKAYESNLENPIKKVA
ncbi:hypothetical protein [Bartonella harrusi]|uniref:Phage related protein n=1 Tax=Bartonella harrusi TaxID=2961895 RepID=A0ABY5EUJ2_9HYPH|nr:hypothetical protein [Bartonella harrusi]UTO29084.1 hypothetical protein NMK50_03755 [Bartonella harrusi]